MAIDKLEGQKCPMCMKDTLTLLEEETEVPYFGKTFIFSMTCSSCHYHKADVEAAETKEPAKYTLDITSTEDLNIRVIKSSEGTVKVPYISTIEPGPASDGYVTNVEGILNRIKEQIQKVYESEEDKDNKNAAYKLIKKINRILWGSEKGKLIIEDPTGNSAIISDKAKKDKLKK
ncbi:MAG: ZPR1 zinc finger domain-containing protein [Nanoarchaeota archaeon]|nr:ZPR1 zinc finger domain-containing protein [Nanoarchaeota archaeon]MBU1704316.1 ZPR1 zinc finger domain-containing protein [Nanoarchaeota archaeon]